MVSGANKALGRAREICALLKEQCVKKRERNLKKNTVLQVELDTCAGLHIAAKYVFSTQLTWVAEPQTQKNVTNFQ